MWPSLPEFIGTKNPLDVYNMNKRGPSWSHFKFCLRHPLGKVRGLQQCVKSPTRDLGGEQLEKQKPPPMLQQLQVEKPNKGVSEEHMDMCRMEKFSHKPEYHMTLICPTIFKYHEEITSFTI